MRSGGSRKQTCDPSTGSGRRLRNTKHMRGCPSRASWHKTTKPKAIKDLGSKCDKGAGKANDLTWGVSRQARQPTCHRAERQPCSRGQAEMAGGSRSHTAPAVGAGVGPEKKGKSGRAEQ